MKRYFVDLVFTDKDDIMKMFICKELKAYSYKSAEKKVKKYLNSIIYSTLTYDYKISEV